MISFLEIFDHDMILQESIRFRARKRAVLSKTKLL